MFGGNKKTVSPASFDTLISEGSEIAGDMHLSGGLQIDGKIFGNLIADDNSSAVVRISDSGMVIGEISAPHVIISGSVTGDIHACESLELAKTAQIEGDVSYNLLEMEMGAQISGQLKHIYRGKQGDRPSMPKNTTLEKPVQSKEANPKVKELPVNKQNAS